MVTKRKRDTSFKSRGFYRLKRQVENSIRFINRYTKEPNQSGISTSSVEQDISNLENKIRSYSNDTDVVTLLKTQLELRKKRLVKLKAKPNRRMSKYEQDGRKGKEMMKDLVSKLNEVQGLISRMGMNDPSWDKNDFSGKVQQKSR